MSFLGLPADPSWAAHILQIVEEKRRIDELDGIGCQTEEMFEWIGDGLRNRALTLPDNQGPIVWPRYSLTALLDEV